jgi:hypothetical protein
MGRGDLSGPVNGLEKLLFLQPILLGKGVLASTEDTPYAEQALRATKIEVLDRANTAFRVERPVRCDSSR